MANKLSITKTIPIQICKRKISCFTPFNLRKKIILMVLKSIPKELLGIYSIRLHKKQASGKLQIYRYVESLQQRQQSIFDGQGSDLFKNLSVKQSVFNMDLFLKACSKTINICFMWTFCRLTKKSRLVCVCNNYMQ